MKKGWHDKAIHQETFDLPHPWCWSCSAKLAKDTLKRTRGMRFLRLRPQKREGMKSITSADCTPRCINYFDKFTPTRINYFGQQNLIAGAYVRPCMWVCVCVWVTQSLQSCPTLYKPMNCRTGDCRAPLSIGFSRQESWSGLPCPPPGDLPNPRIKPPSPVSPALQAGSWLLSHWGSPARASLAKVQ